MSIIKSINLNSEAAAELEAIKEKHPQFNLSNFVCRCLLELKAKEHKEENKEDIKELLLEKKKELENLNLEIESLENKHNIIEKNEKEKTAEELRKEREEGIKVRKELRESTIKYLFKQITFLVKDIDETTAQIMAERYFDTPSAERHLLEDYIKESGYEIKKREE